MNSQDMSIYWNQRKGQYETNDFYQEVQNPFTITADNRLRYQEKSEPTEVRGTYDVKEQDNEVSIASWLGTIIMMLIPGINVFGIIIMAFGAKNENKKSFARAVVLVSLIVITAALIFMALTCEKIDYTGLLDKALAVAKPLAGKVANKII